MKADSFRDFVLDQLQALADVESRAMFGGHGLYAGDVFFGIVYQGRLYFRTNPATRGEFVRRGAQPFRPNEKQTLNSYYEVPADVIEDRRQLADWARRAIEQS
ncbi:MAG TPA: TfoX/Sxy family protein [Haliangiales bacterium]|nr:TfoX/Sxy family protein [Haliangiales bacterium]